jgi:hypothetical protein
MRSLRYFATRHSAAAFDPAHVCTVKPATGGKFLLRQPGLLPQLPNRLPNLTVGFVRLATVADT